jgi:hypothetical protein
VKKIGTIVVLMCLGLGAFAQNGRITELTGTVELKPAGTTVFIAANSGDQVVQSTIVSTGFKSSAVIEVGSATILVRPLTRLSLEEITISQGTEKVQMNLRAGRVRVDVKPPAGGRADFSVVSPSATASVRGTGFEMDTRNLAVNEGSVTYRGIRGAATVVYAGAESGVNVTSGKVADPVGQMESNLLPPAPVGVDAASSDLMPQAGGSTPLVDDSVGFGFDFTS